MVRTKLVTDFINIVNKYIGIPYARNEWRDGVLIKEAVFGGKGSCKEIQYATLCAAEKDNLNIDKLSQIEIVKLQKKHKIGIDCSGLAYHLLDELDRIKGGQGILFKTKSVQKISGTIGVRSISAAELTHPTNSVQIKNYDEIKTGDLIRHHNGTHVLVITEYHDHILSLVHSSKNSSPSGVHMASITITNDQKTLNYQIWSDKTRDNSSFAELFNPENYDGIYRLKCWN